MEIQLKKSYEGSTDLISNQIKDMLFDMDEIKQTDDLLIDKGLTILNVNKVVITDIPEDNYRVLKFWQCQFTFYAYKLYNDSICGNNEPESEDKEMRDLIKEEATFFQQIFLPCSQYDNLWQSLEYDSNIKQTLLSYIETSLLFSRLKVNKTKVNWNNIILLHGPPGTGKTSLCKSLAQKLSIKFCSVYENTVLLEINSQNLFSKWFSESSQLVSKLFNTIHELISNKNSLVILLIDECETLISLRNSSNNENGSDPSDSIRVVNTVLRELDRLKDELNCLILTTSNLSENIDTAFIDRVDIRQYIGLPSYKIRTKIINDSIIELSRVGLITSIEPDNEEFIEIIKETEGLSCRILKKLSFLAFNNYSNMKKSTAQKNENSSSSSCFLQALRDTVRTELINVKELKH